MIPLSDGTLYFRSRPTVTVALLALNGLVFLYSLTVGGFSFLFGGSNPAIVGFFYTWGFIPAEFPGRQPFETLGLGLLGALDITTPVPTWGTIFSAMFMHSGILHFAGNMAFLWVFGRALEDRLGHVKYLAFYLVTGVVATLAHWFFFQGSETPLIGASGAISGVLGAYLFLFPYNRVRVLTMTFIITVLQLNAVYVLGFYLLLQVIQLLFLPGNVRPGQRRPLGPHRRLRSRGRHHRRIPPRHRAAALALSPRANPPSPGPNSVLARPTSGLTANSSHGMIIDKGNLVG